MQQFTLHVVLCQSRVDLGHSVDPRIWLLTHIPTTELNIYLDQHVQFNGRWVGAYRNSNICYPTAYTVVSCIYAPRFATLTLVESVGGAYNYAGSDILSREYAPSSGATRTPRCWHNIILQTDRSCRFALATSSETRWSRSTDRGWPQRRQRRFSSIPRVCPFNVLLLIDTTRGHAIDRRRLP